MKWTNHQDLMKLRALHKKKNKPQKRFKKLKVKNPPKLTKKYKSYKDYLLSPEWKTKRLSVLNRANNICEICKTKKAYQVHHKNYKRIYKEKLSDLIATCGICHQAEHNLLSEEEIEKAVDYLMSKNRYVKK